MASRMLPTYGACGTAGRDTKRGAANGERHLFERVRRSIIDLYSRGLIDDAYAAKALLSISLGQRATAARRGLDHRRA